MTKLSTAIKTMLLVTMVLFLLGIFPQTLYASNVMTSPDLKIRVDGTNGTIVKFTGTQSEYTIPATIRGFQNTTVTIVGIEREAFYNCVNLRTLTIPDTVTSIGEKAFMNCHNLTTVHMPARLDNLGKSAFSYCPKLQSAGR